jgi:hypothetical protein
LAALGTPQSLRENRHVVVGGMAGSQLGRQWLAQIDRRRYDLEDLQTTKAIADF